jgi:predicted transcriptional regulator
MLTSKLINPANDDHELMSNTIKIRLPSILMKKLESVARQQARTKSWVIQRALYEYLNCIMTDSYFSEAQRQCMTANNADKKEHDWEKMGDWHK